MSDIIKHCDTIIIGKWIICDDTVLVDHAVVIDRGNIIAIIHQQVASDKYQSKETIVRDHHIIMAGLINTHTHSPMVLFRGLADDLALMDWLNNHIWPAESKWCHEDFIRDGLLLACAEMIRSGTTCFNEHYFFPTVTTDVVAHVGMRASIGLFMFDHPTHYAANGQEYIDKALNVLSRASNNTLIHYTFAPHAPYTCNDELLKQLKDLNDDCRLHIHMHVQESRDEVNQSLAQFGVRPIKRLHDLGLLNERFINVHMTQVDDEDLAILKDTGAHVVHCPESNLKLASGYCPVQWLLDNQINVALGTDSAASNNNLDMFSEMKTAALIGKTVADDPRAVSANTALNMATTGGAKALGLAGKIGRLAPGLAADMIAIDVNHFNTLPIYHPISHCVYSANSQQVSDVWVAGKQLLKQGKLTTIDEEKLMATTQKWQEKIIGGFHDAS